MTLACPEFVASLDPGLCRAVDIYCERTSEAFDAEPINALSNIAFLIAAVLAWRLHPRANPAAARAVAVLSVMAASIGIGSFLFHIVATRWAEWADVVPIVAFMLTYMWLAMRWLFGIGAWLRVVLISGFSFLTLGMEWSVPPWVLWGGAYYIPALLLLAGVVIALHRRCHPAADAMTKAAGVFFLAFIMRSLDTPLCDALPTGTHFLWHVFDATFVYLLIRLAILYGAAPARATAVTCR